MMKRSAVLFGAVIGLVLLGSEGAGAADTKANTANPKASTAAPEPSTAAPEPSTAAPVPSTAAPKASTAAPKAGTAAPKASTAAPKARAATPKASAAAPKASAEPAKARRYSGIVVTVEPSARTLVVRELAEAGKPRSLDVKVPAAARVVLSERLPAAEIKDLKQPFRDTAIDLTDLRPGDVVTVDSAPERGAGIADQVTVTWRAAR